MALAGVAACSVLRGLEPLHTLPGWIKQAASLCSFRARAPRPPRWKGRPRLPRNPSPDGSARGAHSTWQGFPHKLQSILSMFSSRHFMVSVLHRGLYKTGNSGTSISHLSVL